MNVLPHQIQRDLSGEIRGDVLTGLPVRALYSTAACIYRILPLAVVRPRDAEDVAKVVCYASERGVPITARGGGSGVAGHSIGPGIVLDFSAYMTGVVAEGDDWIEVEPGIVLDRLNAHLSKRGMRFAPDPSSGAYCTVGGMVANNSSGARGIKYGSTRSHVMALEFIDAAGRTVGADANSAIINNLRTGLKRIVAAHRNAIEEHRPRVTKNSSGYQLWDIEAAGGIDIARVIVGSEGTLGIVTKARLRLTPLPSVTGVALLHFRDIPTATAAVPRLRDTDPSAIEIMDAAFLKIVETGRPDLRSLLPDEGHTLLLVEHEATRADELRDRLARTEASAMAGGAVKTNTSADPAGVKRLWAVRKAGSPIISSVRGPRRPLRFVEDVVVPPEKLADYADRFMDILRRNNCVAPIIGHAGDGNVHVNPILDMRDPAMATTIRRVADSVYELVDIFGGSPTGEHGDGRLRAPYLKNHFGPEVYRAFEELKSLFDPKGILNPGVILGESDITDNLRYGVPHVITSTALDEASPREMALQCHGCGDCRQDCPIFRATGAEEMSPRGRLNLVRAIINGELPVEQALHDPAVKAAVEACLACQRCEAGCSSGVDVPLMMSYVKGLVPLSARQRLRHAVIANPRRAFNRLSKISTIVNPILESPSLNMAVRKLIGLNPDRPMPVMKSPNLKVSAARYTQNIASADVIYFPGCIATYVDPDGVGMATLFVLEKLGLKPAIASFGCCGLPRFASGDREGALRELSSSIAALNVNPNAPIITSCPSCARMFKGDIIKSGAPGLVEIARRIAPAESFVLERLDGRFDLDNVNLCVAIQTPCHQRGKPEAADTIKLMERIPGLTIVSLPDTCCGIGGMTGLKVENRGLSNAVSAELLGALADSGADVVLSSCGGCRLALGTVKRDMHPLAIVARALGYKG